MTFDNLLIERDGRVAILTINRPKVLNAMNAATLDELARAFQDLGHDPAVGVVVVTGAGEKAFVAGADINELAVQSPTSMRALALAGQRVFNLIAQTGHRGDQRLRARRRLRACDGVHVAAGR